MAGVDNRIVTMKFDNREFENNAKTSLSTLQKLKESMNFGSIVGGTVRGLGAIESALSRIGLKTPFAPMIRAANSGLGMIGGVLDRIGIKNPFASATAGAGDLQRGAEQAAGGMGTLQGAVTGVSNKFIALTTIAITALTNITNKAINSATQWAKSFTVAPIMDGLHEYELNLKSIQTVQANTDQPLDKINRSLDELNKYSDQTIYNFAEMARNVGTFTAAGVDLDTSVSSIKGIANIAAMSGSSSEQAAGAMYQLSQAIAAGKVGLMDWNSVVNAGMGGKKLQTALAQTAVAMGELDKNAVKTVGSMEKLQINGSSFRESIMAKPGQESWLSSEALVNTLSAMDGRFSEAALAAELTEEGLQKYTKAQIQAKIETARTNMETKNGVKYTDEQFKALQRMSTMAFKSATEVKTLGQVFDVAKESIASGWSASFRNIFGDLKEAKALFTPMSRGLNDLIGQNALARNTMLAEWAKEGGRFAMIEGLKNAWQAVLGILTPIKDGFRDIFPAQTAEGLISMSEKFQEFTQALIPGKDTMSDIRDIASGVFSVFGIVKTILGGVIEGFKTLFGAIGAGNGDFLGFVASIGRAVTEFHNFLQESGLVKAFFVTLGNILSVPIELVKALARGIGAIFDGFDNGAIASISTKTGEVTERFSALNGAADRIRSAFKGLSSFFQNLGETLGEALVNIGEKIADFLTSDAFGPALDAIDTGLLAAITTMIVQFFRGGPSVDITGGVFSQVAGVLEEVTGSLTALQTNLKADALMKIGIAIGVLAASLLVLSTINPADMRKALGAMAAGFGVLVGSLVVLMKFMGPVGIVQIYVVTGALTKMAASILLMAFALKTMAGINFGDMLRGLVGLSIMLRIMTKAMLPLAAGHKGMLKAAGAMIAMGIAINLLAVALKIFASMTWGEMIQGLVGLMGTLLALAAGMKLMPDLNAEAITLIALGVAVNILAVALKIFATMSLGEMAKGLIMLAGSLGIIAIAMRLMPKGMLLQAVALNAVASAMVVLSGALKIMGSMGWENIVKGLVLLAGAMTILALGLNAIGVVGLVGAAGLLAAAAALAILAPVMVTLGSLSWEAILKGLVGIAGLLTILGVAGYLLAPVIPVIIGLGAAVLLLGAGLALAGVGAMAFATAWGIVVAAGSAGVKILGDVLLTLIKAIPELAKALGKGFIQFIKEIANAGPVMVRAMGRIISNLLDAVIRNVPKMGRAFATMIETGLNVIVRLSPKIFAAGLKLIIGFLEAVNRHIPRITDLAVSIITKFINGISRNLPKIIQAGVNLIIRFVNGVATAIEKNSTRMGEAGGRLAVAMVRGMANGISGGAGIIKDAALSAARAAFEAAKDFFRIGSPSKLMRDEIGARLPQGMALGIKDDATLVDKEIGAMGKNAMGTLSRTMQGLEDAFYMDPNLNPTVTPVLDLTKLSQEANKMGSILSTAPIMPRVSYETASDISVATQASAEADNDPDAPGSGGGDTYLTYEQHLHSPTPLDSVKIYRDGKSLISLKKEELAK